MKALARQAGVMLVESLVAITLLAAALGGSAVLLVQALQLERQAASRTAAVRQVTSLAELLRGLVREDGSPLQAVANPAAAAECHRSARDCIVEVMGARRIDEWRTTTLASLPADSLAQVEVSSISPPVYLVTIAWPGKEPAEDTQVLLAIEP